MELLWQHYVFQRGPAVEEMWDAFFADRPIRLLYIAGRGFDPRAHVALQSLLGSLKTRGEYELRAELVLIELTDYELDDDLKQQTSANAEALEQAFSQVGTVVRVPIGPSAADDEDLSPTATLRRGAELVLGHFQDHTDIVLDVSSLPRVVYLALLTGFLRRLVPDRERSDALFAGGVNFQVLVAEDPSLDAAIRSENPSGELVLIPGFSSALLAESMSHWPMVWFPLLGENRTGQLQQILVAERIPRNAEVCPVLPHPSKDPRRADRLLVEFKEVLFDSRDTPTSNVLYVHEMHPFEAYRQLLTAMRRYCNSLRILGGCRIVVTPLASKLITIGAGLACFEMRPTDVTANYGVAIPYAQPTRYTASIEALRASSPEISTMVLTGHAFAKLES